MFAVGFTYCLMFNVYFLSLFVMWFDCGSSIDFDVVLVFS